MNYFLPLNDVGQNFETKILSLKRRFELYNGNTLKIVWKRFSIKDDLKKSAVISYLSTSGTCKWFF